MASDETEDIGMAFAGSVEDGRGAQERPFPRRNPIRYGRGRTLRRLNERQLADYKSNGFVVLPQIFSRKNLLALLREMKRLDRECNAQIRAGLEPVPRTPGKSFRDVHKASRLFARLGADKRIVDRVRQILGGPVHLHHAEINVADTKSGNSWPWHAQFERWNAQCGIPGMQCVEAWVMLTDSTPYNGPMRVLEKSQHARMEYARDSSENLRGPSPEMLDKLLAEAPIANLYCDAGTLVLSDSRLICGSTASAVPLPRALVMYSYHGGGDQSPHRTPIARGREMFSKLKAGKRGKNERTR